MNINLEASERSRLDKARNRLKPGSAVPPWAFLNPHTEMPPSDRALFIVAVATTIIAIIAACAAFIFARPVLIPITTAFVLSILLAPAAEWLRRRAVPSGARAFIVVFFAFSLFVSALYLAVQPGAVWMEKLPDVIDQARDKLIGVQEAVTKAQDVSDQVNDLTDLGDRQPTEVVTVQTPRLSTKLFSSVRNIVVQILFTAVLTYFVLASRDDVRRKFILLRSNLSGMLQTARMTRAVEKKVGAYMFTMLIINIGLGVATGIGMLAIGMPSPLIWAGLAAILNFVPYLGPITLTVLLTLTGLVHFETFAGAVVAPMIYIVLNFIESNFITPTLIGVRLTISPLAVILNISFWTWLWGPAGAVLSIPVLVIFKTVCDYSTFLRPIGLLIGDADTFRPAKPPFRDIKI